MQFKFTETKHSSSKRGCNLQNINMTKQELIKLMRLLAAMEAVGMMQKPRFPEFILEDVIECVDILEREILK